MRLAFGSLVIAVTVGVAGCGYGDCPIGPAPNCPTTPWAAGSTQKVDGQVLCDDVIYFICGERSTYFVAGQMCIGASVVFALPPDLPKGTCKLQFTYHINDAYCSPRSASCTV